MSIVDGARSHYRLFGPSGVMVIARARLSRKPMQISIAAGNHSHPVHLRMRTTDVSLYEEIIVNAEYEFEINREPSVVVDAGANIGLTSVYFANRYPNAKIIAIEPEPSNFKMLVKNTERYPNIVPVEAALWRSDTMVDLSDPGSGNWGFQTEERQQDTAGGTRVRGLTIDTLMRETGIEHIDILKVDIEGSEKEVFESCSPWIDKIGVLVVEFHDRWKSGCSDTVRAAAKDFPIAWTRGETTFFLRPEFHKLHAASQGHAARPLGSMPAGAAIRPRIVGVHT
jgi:FkbM family methyltransferase